MEILIDNQRGLEVPAHAKRTEEGLRLFVTPDSFDAILNAWMELNPAHRAYEPISAADGGASSVILAWVNGVGALCTRHITSWWVGGDVGFNLCQLAEALPEDMLRWGESIGEPDPLAGAR